MKVVVTGVSRGIGRALINQYLEGGHHCIGMTRSVSSLPRGFLDNDRFEPIQWNGSDHGKLVSEHANTFKGTDILINNAASIIVKPFHEITNEEMVTILDTNVISPFNLIRSIYNKGCFGSGAHVVNISSMGGYQGALKFPGLSAYSMSKSALVAMTESLSVELNDVAINCLCLGAVQTEMLKTAFPNYNSEISDVDMAKYIADFSLSSGNVMSGSVISVKKNDPIS